MKIKSILFGVFIMAFGAISAAGQDDYFPMIMDPAVRVGVLDNGMKFYLRHNSKPAGMAEFYIVHDVGAIQEEDSQVGLAHFLEHMAFNGTENLPDKQLINYLETIGVKFGTNLNAATGIDMTYYMMSHVPIERESVIDSALLILHDWSHFIALKGDEIDKERGVIIEELRARRNANERIREKMAKAIYNNNKYASRNIIGTEEQLRNFSHQEIRDFYHRWYRPDLQAIVIVGDFDVDVMEEKLKKAMADIPAVVNPEPKEYYPIADNTEPIIAVETDPEITGSSVLLLIKREAVPKEMNNSLKTVMINYVIRAGTDLTNRRLSEIAQKPDAPFLSAQLANNSLSSTNDAFIGSVVARNNEIPRALEALYTEVEKIRRFGFSESEVARYKTDMMEKARQKYLTRGDRESNDLAQQCISNFIRNTPISAAEAVWALDSLVYLGMSTEKLNDMFPKMLVPENNVVIASAPKKDGISVPTPDELLAIINRVREADIDNYEDVVVDEPLISHDITPGKVVKTEEGKFGSTVWTLSNGAKVILKPTDFRKERINMNAYADGGSSMLNDDDFSQTSMIMTMVGSSGVGKFSETELKRVLTGKNAEVKPEIARFSTGMSGNSSKKDVETMLQLVYLNFTQPRFVKEDFDRHMAAKRNELENESNTPVYRMSKEVVKTMYGDHLRARLMTPELLDEIKFEKMAPIYEKFFKDNANEYTFFFAGDLDLDEIKPLVEKYIGGLPAGNSVLKSKDDGLEVKRGKINNRFKTKMETPMSVVLYLYSGDMEFTQENAMLLSLLDKCLNSRYLESIREDKGGTYSVNVRSMLDREPKEAYTLQIAFQTNPGMVDELVGIVEDELRNIAENGPRQEDVDKTIENWVKSRPETLRENSTWLGYLQYYYIWGNDYYTHYDEIMHSLTGDKVKTMAQKILKDGNLIKIVMDPE